MGLLNATGFRFNGIPCQLFDLFIGYFGEEDEIQTGLNRDNIKGEVNLVRHTANQYGMKYNDTIKFDFYVFRMTGDHFTQEESRAINKWLSPTTYKTLIFNDPDPENVHFNAICTGISDVVINGFNGKHLQFECDSPFGYTPLKIFKLDATGGSSTLKLFNSSDTEYYYPAIEIICGGSYTGTVKITNTSDSSNYMQFNMSQVPAHNSKKTLLVNASSMQVLDGYNNTVIPAYKIGWTIPTDPNTDVQSVDKYWFRLVEKFNTIKVSGTSTVNIKCMFPRKVGAI